MNTNDAVAKDTTFLNSKPNGGFAGLIATASKRTLPWRAYALALLSTVAFCWSPLASALSVTPISQGPLPSGDIIVVMMITLDPGDTVPWHYHTGHGWGTVTSGTITEDEGCGAALVTHTTGSAWAEIPGHVHEVLNLGTTPAVFSWVEIYPACDPNNGGVFVTGPTCLGNSGKSQLEPVPHCDHPDKQVLLESGSKVKSQTTHSQSAGVSSPEQKPPALLTANGHVSPALLRE